jgi:hypothetical protein
MRSNAVGRRRRNQNQITEVYHHEICLRAEVLSRRLLPEVFCAEHQSKTKKRLAQQGVCSSGRIFDGDVTPQLQVPRAICLTHANFTEERRDFVRPELFTDS